MIYWQVRSKRQKASVPLSGSFLQQVSIFRLIKRAVLAYSNNKEPTRLKAIETRYASETSRTTEKIVHFILTSLKRAPSEATQGIYNKLNNINEYAEMGVKRVWRKLPRFSTPPARVPKIPITEATEKAHLLQGMG